MENILDHCVLSTKLDRHDSSVSRNNDLFDRGWNWGSERVSDLPQTTQADVDFKCKPYWTLTSVLSLDCPTSRQLARWHWLIVILKGVHRLCRVPLLCFILILIIPCGEDPLCARHWVRCLHRPCYKLPCMIPGRWGPHLVRLSSCSSWPSSEGLVHTQAVISSFHHKYFDGIGMLTTFL